MPTWLMMRTVTFVSVLVAVLVAFAIAGFVAWWVPVAALVVWGIIAVVGDQSRCDQCGKIFEVDRTVYHDQTCRRCRAIDDLLHRETLTAERDHRLSRLLNRASLAAIGDAQTWPREEEREELEIRLRPLGPEVELAWRAILRAAEALKEALSANGSAPARDEAIKLAAERQSEAIRVLLDAVRSVRETRRVGG
jgi:phage FluMu protein Com